MLKYFNYYGEIDLPEALTQREFELLYNEYKSGNKEIKNYIIECNLKLVLTIINKYFNNYDMDRADMLELGNIGLIKAFNSYDDSKKIAFVTYASKCIYNEILMGYRKWSSNKQKINNNINSLDEEIEDGISLYDMLTDEEDFTSKYDKDLDILSIREALELLNDRDKEIIKLYFGFYDKEYTQYEISKMYNIQQSYVSRLIKSNIKKLKKEFFKIEENIER